jgi:hypothetical protein
MTASSTTKPHTEPDKLVYKRIRHILTINFNNTAIYWGTLLVAQLVEALRYMPEGRGFDSRWCHWIFSLA